MLSESVDVYNIDCGEFKGEEDRLKGHNSWWFYFCFPVSTSILQVLMIDFKFSHTGVV